MGDDSSEETIDTSSYLKPIIAVGQEEEESKEEEEENSEIAFKNSDRFRLDPAQNYLAEILKNLGILNASQKLVIKKFNTFVQNPIDE